MARRRTKAQNASKRIGSTAERKVVDFLITQGIWAERRTLHGSRDQGDVKVYLSERCDEWVTLEVKGGKQTESWARNDFEEWMRQTKVEIRNDKGTKGGALVIVRFRRSIENAEVMIPRNGIIQFMYLDTLAKIIKEKGRWPGQG